MLRELVILLVGYDTCSCLIQWLKMPNYILGGPGKVGKQERGRGKFIVLEKSEI